MQPDDELCLCFHVTQRKVANFLRVERPARESQMSECFGAGTGCGWCIPFLKQIFRKGTEPGELESLTPDEYAKQRAAYVAAGKGTPPPGAEPLPMAESE